MKVVVLISANAEWHIVKEMFPDLELQQSPFGRYGDLALGGFQVTLFHGGWGKIAASASTQYVIDNFKPDLLVNLGTCGGFSGRIEAGTVILVERTLVYDILELMGDGVEATNHYATNLDLNWLPADLPQPARRGFLVSADRDIVSTEIPMLIEKYDAVAADWESGAIAWTAARNRKPLLILRAVSDLVDVHGGEAYGNIPLFHERTRKVMRELFDQLPSWLGPIGRELLDPADQGQF